MSFALQGISPMITLNDHPSSLDDLTLFTIINGSLLGKMSLDLQYLKGFIGVLLFFNN